MLEAPRSSLHIMATSKGLVAGNLTFINLEDGTVVDCGFRHSSRRGSSQLEHGSGGGVGGGGELVPQDVSRESLELRCPGGTDFVLVVEKDATFQALLQEGFLAVFDNAVMVTGKGVPDLSTRRLVHRLWAELGLPVFILVDADPFGIEIMCTYKFGSLALVWCGDDGPMSATPGAKWIGLHPTDFEHLDADQLSDLTEVDKAKWRALYSRPYVVGCARERGRHPDDDDDDDDRGIGGGDPEAAMLREQLDAMATWGKKAEIQSLPSPSRYVACKIKNREWIG